jgi:uncharacterized Zn-binding protein involved in type VI secretion
MRKIMACLIAIGVAVPAFAQQAPQQVVTGDPTVSVEGSQAATSGDATSGGKIIVEGSSNVFINGKPAAVVGVTTNCGGKVATGAATVFINGKPMASSGSVVTGCPQD